MRILLIEDDQPTAEFIINGLHKIGHVCDHADNGVKGLLLLKTAPYDVAIVDRMIPLLDGLSVLRDARANGCQTPALILSALGQVDDRVTGLRAGGDDYLVKPFALVELVARLEVLAKRGQNGKDRETRLSHADLTVDLITRTVTRGLQDIVLQAREFRLLEFLLRHKGQIVTRTMLLENVWDYHFDPQTNVIDVHISRLRAKIDKGFPTTLIKTIRNAGYILE